MARTLLATQQIDDDGLVPVFTAANVDGHWIEPDAYIEVVNAAASPINVTIQTGGTLGGKAVEDTVVPVADGTRQKVGGFDKRTYARPTGVAEPGMIYVDFSDVTTITVGAFRD